MLETIAGLTPLGEELIGASIAIDILQPEVLLAEAAVILGVMIFRAIKKHHQKKQNDENKPSDADQDVPQPDPEDQIDEADAEQAQEEAKQEEEKVQREIDDEMQNEEDERIFIEEAVNVEQAQEIDLLADREARLEQLRQQMGLIPDDGLYEIINIEDQFQQHNQNNGGGNGPNGGGNGPNGGGNGPNGDGGNGDDPDPNHYNPNNDNENRGRNPRENPYQEMLKEMAMHLAEQYFNRTEQDKKDEQEHKDGKITDEELKDRQTESEQIKQQLETQKQLMDILDAMGLNELTDEQSLVELEKIDQDIKNLQQQQVKVGDVFANDLVTF